MFGFVNMYLVSGNPAGSPCREGAVDESPVTAAGTCAKWELPWAQRVSGFGELVPSGPREGSAFGGLPVAPGLCGEDRDF